MLNMELKFALMLYLLIGYITNRTTDVVKGSSTDSQMLLQLSTFTNTFDPLTYIQFKHDGNGGYYWDLGDNYVGATGFKRNDGQYDSKTYTASTNIINSMISGLNINCDYGNRSMLVGWTWKFVGSTIQIVRNCRLVETSAPTVCTNYNSESFNSLDEDGNYGTLKGLANMPVLGDPSVKNYYFKQIKLVSAGSNNYYFTYMTCKMNYSCNSKCITCSYENNTSYCGICAEGYYSVDTELSQAP